MPCDVPQHRVTWLVLLSHLLCIDLSVAEEFDVKSIKREVFVEHPLPVDGDHVVNAELAAYGILWVPTIVNAGAIGNISAVQAQLRAGVHVDKIEPFMHHTALIFAAAHGFLDVTKVLLDAGANPMHRDCHKVTAMGHVLFQLNAKKIAATIPAGKKARLRQVASLLKEGETRAQAQGLKPNVPVRCR